MADERRQQWRLAAEVVVAVVATLFLFHAAQAVFVPIVLAFYVVLMLLPVHAGLHRRLPRGLRWLATPLTVLVPLAALAVVGVLLWQAGLRMAEEGEVWRASLVESWQQARAWLGWLGVPVRPDGNGLQVVLQAVGELLSGALFTSFRVFLSSLLVVFLVLLALAERTTWVRKTQALFLHTHAESVFEIFAESSAKVQVFLLWRTVTGIASGAVVGALAWALGVGLVPIWFLLQWLSNYVPTIGAVVAGVLPALFALVTVGWQTALWMGLGITATEQLVGTFLGTRLQGRGLSLSPVAVLVSLLLFGWAWGLVGGLLSAPILATVHVVCRRVPELLPIAILIARDPEDEGLWMPGRGPEEANGD